VGEASPDFRCFSPSSPVSGPLVPGDRAACEGKFIQPSGSFSNFKAHVERAAPSTAYRNCPASVAGEGFLCAKALRRSEPLRDFRPAVLES
jgi:hypothetical protein